MQLTLEQSALIAVASVNPPNWRRPLEAYLGDWPKAISAWVVSRDRSGPTVIYWMGHHYIRRCGQNPKYGAAIWFSRSMGRNEAGESQYARLITFSDAPPPSAEPLPDYVVQALSRATR